MAIKDLIIYFITGGLFTTLIVFFEESGQKTISGFATLMPVFTLIAYFFIGQKVGGGQAVSQHAKWVLVGTFISWVPYMLVVAYLAPKIGSNKAILAGLITFFILALIYIPISNKLGFFQ